jgi:hypothetical protein
VAISGPPIELRPLFEEFNRQINGIVTVAADKIGAAPHRRSEVPVIAITKGSPEPAAEEVG